MLAIGALFFIIGSLGLLWSTIAAPVAGFWLASLQGKRRGAVSPAASTPLELDVLIAAHNEQEVIVNTLASVVEAARRLTDPKVSVGITVGCDHCTDGTRAAVEAFAKTSPVPVRALENPGKNGKWNVLGFLIGQSRADWVALVDAASIWNPELLERIWPSVLDPAVIGVAPSYAPAKGGALERYNWRLEQFLKRLENGAGGPVSVHGASVLYRRAELVSALGELTGVEWLNDDVVIPLTLRLSNPERRLVYYSEGIETGWVSDIGVRSELGVEYRRRRRMLVGNLQWVRLILASRWSESLVVSAIASRRFSRMLWAYWVLLLGLGLGLGSVGLISDRLGVDQYLNVFLICASVSGASIWLLARSNWARRLLMAFLSGLQLPRYWKEFGKDRGVLWL